MTPRWLEFADNEVPCPSTRLPAGTRRAREAVWAAEPPPRIKVARHDRHLYDNSSNTHARPASCREERRNRK